MIQRIHVLQSKLLIPQIKDTIQRKRLQEVSDQILHKRLTTVTAGAGYGKSTFVAQAVQNRDVVWYRLNSSDKDFVTFLSYLITGIQKYYPAFGEETFRRFKDPRVVNREQLGVFTTFLHELETTVSQELVVVLDDYHLIQNNHGMRHSTETQEISDIQSCLPFLIEHLSSTIHLILISRAQIELPLTRLLATRELIDISSDVLAFTPPEIDQLYRQMFNIPLRQDDLEMLYDKTDGWVSGLILFCHTLKGKSPADIDITLSKLKGSTELISKYLEENVYDSLSEEKKSFLTKTSVLSALHSDFCNKLLHIDNAQEILKNLEKSRLFTFSFDEEHKVFHYHHLFKEFLLSKLQTEIGQESILQLHNTAAKLHEERCEYEEALKHYISSQTFEQASRVLNDIGPPMAIEGRLHLVNSYLGKIPDQYYQDKPWILFIKGQIQSLGGKNQEALVCFQKALSLFQTENNQIGIQLCFAELAVHYLFAGDFPKAEAILKEILKTGDLAPIASILTIGTLLTALAHLSKIDEADRYYNQGLSLLNVLDGRDLELARAFLNSTYGWRYFFSGDYLKAIDLAKKALVLLECLDIHHLIGHSHFLLSGSLYYLGHYKESLENAKNGLRIAKEKGYKDFSTGWLLVYASLNASELGRVQEALEFAEESLSFFQKQDTPYGKSASYQAFFKYHVHTGNLEAAAVAIHEALDLSKHYCSTLFVASLRFSLAYLFAVNGNYKDALCQLKEIESYRNNNTYVDFGSASLYSLIWWKQGKTEKALSSLLYALKISEANQYDKNITIFHDWIIPLLIAIYAQGELREYIVKLIIDIGAQAEPELRRLQRSGDVHVSQSAKTILRQIPNLSPPGLNVSCLGRFIVRRGDEELSADSWKSKKVRMLFLLLIHYRESGHISKEVFMEHLWPEEQPKKSAKRFHVALATLRKILEPEIEQGIPSAYIQSLGDTYCLNLGNGGQVDVDAFYHAGDQAKKTSDPHERISHLLNAVSLYQGDFLAEDLYDDWCAEKRDRIKEQYLLMLVSIIDHYEQQKEYHQAVEFCGRYLTIEPSIEELYQRLMHYYAELGNKSMLMKTYECCTKAIVDELGYPLTRKTERLYADLMKNT
jgi:LuxR family maltose regulon positive regulatory protein